MKKIAAASCMLLLVIFLYAQSGTSLQHKSADAAEALRLNNLGAAYMNQQEFEKALKYFQQASQADPKLEAAQLNQGIALLNQQKTEQALPLLEGAIKRDPKNARAWYNLGLLYKNGGDAKNAV